MARSFPQGRAPAAVSTAVLALIVSSCAFAQANPASAWTQQQELTASDGAAEDYFSYSVSVSGDTAVIGAYGAIVAYGTTSGGKAYVFVRSAGVWSLQQELPTPDGAIEFGHSVVLSGDTAVIGAYTIGNQGTAYVFVRSGGVWAQQQRLTASDGAAADYFGNSASVSGDTAVIGAWGKSGAQGAAYVFVRSNGVWSQQQELTASDGAAGDSFGEAVSVSADTAVIGAYCKNGYQGAAYVFIRNGGVWAQQQKLLASDGAAGEYFGNSASVSGDTAVIGAESPPLNRPGAAYVFVRSGAAWSQQQKLSASDGAANDDFGGSVSVSGDTAVIGALGKTSKQGAAYVFSRSGGVWNQQQELTAPDGAGGDFFGTSVSASAGTALIGAFGKNSKQGAAYVLVGPTLGASALLVGSAAGSSSVVLSDSGAWTAAANDSFLHISAGSASGTGNAVVVFTYDAFSGTGTRTGTLTIGGTNTVTVVQAGGNYLGPSPMMRLGPRASWLDFPQGLAVDASGNVYVADTLHNAVQKLDPSARLVLGALVSSGLAFPTSVAVDASGNVYIADSRNNAIKEWSASTAQVSTLVSSGLNSPLGVALDSTGNIYIADCGNNAIKEWGASTQQVTTLVSSGLNCPSGAAVDIAGNVYIADSRNNAVKEWNASTQGVTTLVSSGLGHPSGVAVDASGNVYIANTNYSSIQEWSAATQQVSTLVSTGLDFPSGLALDGAGNVYIADTVDDVIQEIPHAFVGPSSFTEPASAGSDSLLPVLPSTTPLTGYFEPTSDQSWLTIGTIANGVIGFSFTANTSASARTAHIAVLGQSIAVAQSGAPPVPVLTVTKAHTGDFAQAQSGAAYTVTVGNALGTGPTSGTVAVTETAPTGLTLVSMAGAGWTCPAGGNTCTRGDPLAVGASYAAITVTVNVAANAPSPQVNSVTVSGGGSASASATDTTIIGFSVAPTYLIGDVTPYTADTAGAFGDGILNIQDLIQELFAVNSIPGFRPAACSDRFDAMDAYPADTASTRGGDGILDVRDLIEELFRVNDLDTSRPVRTSLGGALPWAGCASGSSGSSISPTEVVRRSAPPRRPPSATQGALALGRPEQTGAAEERIPVYLEAKQDLVRVAVTFALGAQQSQLRFVPTPESPPSLVQDGQLGVVAVAWLNGVNVRTGEPLLLGYVAGSLGFSANLKVYGASASGLDDNREVPLDAPAAPGLRQ